MTEKPPTFCRHCGKRITAWVNDIPWCDSKKCMARLYALLPKIAQKARGDG